MIEQWMMELNNLTCLEGQNNLSELVKIKADQERKLRLAEYRFEHIKAIIVSDLISQGKGKTEAKDVYESDQRFLNQATENVSAIYDYKIAEGNFISYQTRIKALQTLISGEQSLSKLSKYS